MAPGTLAAPSFPSEFASEDAAAAAKGAGEEAPASGVPEKLTFSFFLPHATLGKGKKVCSRRNPSRVVSSWNVRPSSAHHDLSSDASLYFLAIGLKTVVL